MNDQTPIRSGPDDRPATEAAEPMGRLAKKHEQAHADPDRMAKIRKWQAENAEAIASSNAWVREHGLPLAKYRKF